MDTTRTPWHAAPCRAILLMALAIAGCSVERDSATPHVLVITVDTTRADRLGAFGHRVGRSPHLDRLARGGAQFANAITVAPVTLPSHISLMTGTYPAYHGVRDNGIYVLSDEANVTLAETLSEAGYFTIAVLSAFVLHERFGLGQGFDVYDDDPSAMQQVEYRSTPERLARDTTRAALEHARAGIAEGGPLFLWVHYFDPHAPFVAPRPYPSLVSRAGGKTSAGYDAEIAYVDSEIAALLEGLDDLGVLESSLVVVAGDHGEGLDTPHDEETHGIFVYDETLRVPLLIRDYRRDTPARLIEEPVSLVDVQPTILDLAGLPTLADVQGRSLAGALDDEGFVSPRPCLSETFLPYHTFGWSPLFAIRSEGWKFIRAPKEELYDLLGDPGEQVNRTDAQRDRARDLDALLSVQLGAHERRLPTARASLSEEERDKLRALGYLSQDAPETDLPEDGRYPDKDPKEFLTIYRSLLAASEEAKKQNWARAISLLRGVLQKDPQNFRARCNLGDFLIETGNPDAALKSYQDARELKPGVHEIYFRLGRVHEILGNRERERGATEAVEGHAREAEAAFLRAIEIFPSDHQSITMLAVIVARSPDRGEEAVTWYGRAIEAGPGFRAAHLGLGSLLQRLDRPGEALVALEAARAIAEDAEILVRIGDCRGRLGETDAARESYRRALEIDPRHGAARKGLQGLGD